MKYIYAFALSFLSFSNASASSALICEANGKIDGIYTLHAEDSSPLNELCVQTNDVNMHCSKGSIIDPIVEVSSSFQIGIGTTKVVLEKSTSSTDTFYKIKKTFTCDWDNGEEKCAHNSPAVILQSELVDCMLVRE